MSMGLGQRPFLTLLVKRVNRCKFHEDDVAIATSIRNSNPTSMNLSHRHSHISKMSIGKVIHQKVVLGEEQMMTLSSGAW